MVKFAWSCFQQINVLTSKTLRLWNCRFSQRFGWTLGDECPVQLKLLYSQAFCSFQNGISCIWTQNRSAMQPLRNWKRFGSIGWPHFCILFIVDIRPKGMVGKKNRRNGQQGLRMLVVVLFKPRWDRDLFWSTRTTNLPIIQVSSQCRSWKLVHWSTSRPMILKHNPDMDALFHWQRTDFRIQ